MGSQESVVEDGRSITLSEELIVHDRKILLNQIDFSYEPVYEDDNLLKKLFFLYSRSKQEMNMEESIVFINDFKEMTKDESIQNLEFHNFEKFKEFLKNYHIHHIKDLIL